MPVLTIDNKRVECAQGKTVIEAARQAGIDVPHYCWHPGLSVAGNCRLCLVEIEKMPKLAIACSTIATEGMVVNTQSVKTVEARDAMMEFLLINHPLDCPICDEAGQCKLQDYAFKFGSGESRFTETKVHKPKRVEFGPNVVFDAERCISCSRCIRFCNEIAEEPQIGFVERGDLVTIETFPGQELDNAYAMNTIDICPVGALTSRDFRFKARVWDMSFTPSVCVGCAKGCNTEIGVRNNEILRLEPRENPDVNEWWMCDVGRLTSFRHVNAPSRIDGTFVGEHGTRKKVEWQAAISHAASLLKKNNPGETAFVASAHLTNEDLFLIKKIARHFGSSWIDTPIHEGEGDDYLIQRDKTPNGKSVALLGMRTNKLENLTRDIKEKKIKALVVVGEDLNEYAGLSEVLSQLGALIVIASNESPLTERADVLFGAATFAEVEATMIQCDGYIQKLNAAVMTRHNRMIASKNQSSRLDKFGTPFDRWAQGNKYDAHATWTILQMIANACGAKWDYRYAEDVFEEFAREIGVRGVSYESLAERSANVAMKEAVTSI